MIKEAYENGCMEAMEKISSAIPGGNMTLLERLAAKNAPAVKQVKKVTERVQHPHGTIDYSKLNKFSGRDHRPGLIPEPKPDWNLIRG